MKKEDLLLVVRVLSEQVNLLDAENKRLERILSVAQQSINEKNDTIELLEKKLQKAERISNNNTSSEKKDPNEKEAT